MTVMKSTLFEELGVQVKGRFVKKMGVYQAETSWLAAAAAGLFFGVEWGTPLTY